MLQDVVDYGTASAVRSMGLRAPLGGKTGTTSEFKDAWFVGFSTSVVAGVWIGYDQPQPIGPDAYGARVALPVWADFMRRTALPAEEWSPPADAGGRLPLPHLVPAAGRRVPGVHRVLQGGRRDPEADVPGASR